MKILISHPESIQNELVLINKLMLSSNWDLFHLRKPNWSIEQILDFWKELDSEVKIKTIFHSGFKGSCHSFDEVEELDGKMNYCFLSPIFDSISKQGYTSKFDVVKLKIFLKKKRKIKVIALGGVTESNYNELINLGFDGGAFLGAVWKKYE